jgi:hypothetical protein
VVLHGGLTRGVSFLREVERALEELALPVELREAAADAVSGRAHGPGSSRRLRPYRFDLQAGRPPPMLRETIDWLRALSPQTSAVSP